MSKLKTIKSKYQSLNAKYKTIKVHVKICKSKNLCRMDSIGKADPYVIFRLKSQQKSEKQTTKIESNTLNPVWNLKI